MKIPYKVEYLDKHGFLVLQSIVSDVQSFLNLQLQMADN